MKLINTGTIDITVEGNVLPAGKASENIDDTLARQIVAGSGGAIAIAPEAEHSPEELAHADEKPQPERQPEIPMRLDQYRLRAQVTPEGKIEGDDEEAGKRTEPKKKPSTKTEY